MALAIGTIAAPAGLSATPALQAEIKAGCMLSTNWGDAACTCVADKAAELNDLQQSFLAATMNQQQAQAAQTALQMSQAETQGAAMFLANAAPSCQ
jgi:hypothetical protein